LGSLQNEEINIRGYERQAEQVRMEARAHYMDWRDSPKAKDEKPAFSFRKALLPQDLPDYKMLFDESGESSKMLSL
jgi:hypothetical protein